MHIHLRIQQDKDFWRYVKAYAGRVSLARGGPSDRKHVDATHRGIWDHRANALLECHYNDLEYWR